MHQLALEYGAIFWSSTVDYRFKPNAFPESVENYEWLKFGFHSEDRDKIAELWRRLKTFGKVELSSSGRNNIEVNPKGVTKATGLQKVCSYMGIEPSQVVTIGDGLNDLPMIRWAGFGIAMDNAPDEVKKAAQYTTGSYLHDGVAKAIEYIVKYK